MYKVTVTGHHGSDVRTIARFGHWHDAQGYARQVAEDHATEINHPTGDYRVIVVTGTDGIAVCWASGRVVYSVVRGR